jgi:hypothetical protein
MFEYLGVLIAVILGLSQTHHISPHRQRRDMADYESVQLNRTPTTGSRALAFDKVNSGPHNGLW